VLPVAYLTTRYGGRTGALANALVVAGFALPGLVIALAVVFWALRAPLVGGLYQTFPLLVFAYVVHFGAQAMRASQVAVGSVPRRLDDAARVLGADRWRRLRSVELPLMLPGLVAGGGLVLLSTMKELPATLMLRPTEVETLAVHVWRARETAAWADTGLSAIVLVALSALLTWALVLRRVARLD
jgi:iron(III) transport system permease protein